MTFECSRTCCARLSPSPSGRPKSNKIKSTAWLSTVSIISAPWLSGVARYQACSTWKTRNFCRICSSSTTRTCGIAVGSFMVSNMRCAAISASLRRNRLNKLIETLPPAFIVSMGFRGRRTTVANYLMAGTPAMPKIPPKRPLRRSWKYDLRRRLSG